MADYKIEQVVDLFFNGIENGDETALQSVYADNIKVWHSFTDAEASKAEGIALLMALISAGAQIKYAVEEQLVVGNRVVRRHKVTITGAGGKTVVLPVSIFMTIEGNQITRIDEYVDSNDVKKVAEAAGG